MMEQKTLEIATGCCRLLGAMRGNAEAKLARTRAYYTWKRNAASPRLTDGKAAAVAAKEDATPRKRRCVRPFRASLERYALKT